MKKSVLRKLRQISEEVLGKEETDRIIKNTVEKVIEETKPKKKTKKGDK